MDRWRVPAAGLALALVAAGAWSLSTCTRPRPQITEQNYRAIRHGMTRAEVEAILGAPPGDYAGGHHQYAYCVTACQGAVCDLFDNPRYGWWRARAPEEIAPTSPGGQLAVWWGKEYAVGVEFDAEGRVVGTGLGHAYAREPGPWECLWEWLGWEGGREVLEPPGS